jgi:hypothetical protein
LIFLEEANGEMAVKGFSNGVEECKKGIGKGRRGR